MKAYAVAAKVLKRKGIELTQKPKINWSCRCGQGEKLGLRIHCVIIMGRSNEHSRYTLR